MRSIWRACGPLPALTVLTVGAACSDPELASELNDGGPPEIVQVNVRTESAVLGAGDPTGLQAGESATFCRSGDQYQVNQVYCPEARDANNAPRPGVREVSPVTDAAPGDWYVRIIFDELLDADVEDLVTDADGNTTGHINRTQPVVLRCGGIELEYDGYYDPTGNQLSQPPGPALVVDPNDFVATGTQDCEVSIAEVTDKDGEAVPGGQIGPYAFGIAPLRVYGSNPADASTGVALDTAVQVSFGAPIALASAEDTIVLTDEDGDVVETAAPQYLMADGEVIDRSVVVLTPTAPLAPDTRYTVTVNDGVTDIESGALVQEAPFTASFTTGGAE
jgi:hypothetical protein